MKLNKNNWLLVLLGIVVFVEVGANELGFGICAFVPLTLLAYWLMEKLYTKEKPGG